METECVYDKLNLAVRRNEVTEVRKILKSAVVDLGRYCGDNGNMLNVAIEHAEVEVLAELLGVEYALKKDVIVLTYDKHSLLLYPCDSIGLTPLMKAAKLGKHQKVSLLLSCGADVNAVTPGGKSAIDMSHSPKVALALFEHDSLFPRDWRDSEIEEFKRFVSGDEKLRDLFRARDAIHSSLETGEFDSDIRAVFESGKWVYCVNSDGHAALYTAGMSKNYDAWAYMMDQGMLCANEIESEELKEVKTLNEEMFERSLERLFFPIKGSHVMKLVSRSAVFGSMKSDEDLSSKVLGFFRHLDEDEITSTLLQVLQDVHGLQIAFDFDSVNIERMRVACSRGDLGITDFEKNRICVGAKEMDGFGFPEIVSNLAHEMSHMAVSVVFKNGGLPYFQGDALKKDDYNKVKEDVLDPLRLQNCDDIIRRVKNYPGELHGCELIVRVPEMVAKYHRSDLDGFEHLKSQAPELLDYYEQHVQPEFQEYVDRNFTSNRITGRGLMAYQNLLTSYQSDRIQVCEDIDKDLKNFAGKHNGIMVYKSTSVKLMHSHLSLSLTRSGKVAPLFVDWSLYSNCRDLLIKGLKCRRIETLAISWDLDSPPKFCDRQSCWKDTCPGRDFRDLKECVVFLLNSDWPVLKSIRPLEYMWVDLSKETKELILKKAVNFGGKMVTLKELFSSKEIGEDLDNLAKDLLDPSDITLLFEEEKITIGKPCPWLSGEEDNIIFKHPGCFISRTLTQKYVELNDEVLRRYGNDVFFVSNVDFKFLRGLGINEEYIKNWDSNNSDGHVRCYFFDPNNDERSEEEVFKEIWKHIRSKGYAQMLHFLKLRQGMFTLINSLDCGRNVGGEKDTREGLLSSRSVENLDTSAFKVSEVMLIADDPGTGKTIHLNYLAKEIKKWHPKKWVSLIDLSLKEQQNHLGSWAKSSPPDSEVTEWLFQMIKSGSLALERKVFEEYCSRENEVLILFDGFDEICPKYKSAITSFLVGLQKLKSNIKLFVSTRLDEKRDLEEVLNAISFQLAPFTEDDQIKFLNEYWNALLKNLPLEERREKVESFIDDIGRWVEEENNEVFELREVLSKSRNEDKPKHRKLNFKPVAKRVISCKHTFFEGTDRFTETPLHIQMVATIIFEDSLNVRKTINLGHLYHRFYDLKMKMFGRDKARDSGNVQADHLVKMGQKKITKTLEELAANLLLDERVYAVKSSDVGDVLSIGLLSIKDGVHQFVHRTFAEFFFARWMIVEANTDRVTRLWLQRVLVEDEFARIRDFLEDILSLLAEGVISKEETEDVLLLEKAGMISTTVNDDELVKDLIISTYSLIFHCNFHILQYFADSFRIALAKAVLIGSFMGFDCKDWNLPDGSQLSGVICRYISSQERGNHYENAFSFASFCIVKETSLLPSKYIRVVAEMLGLVECFKVVEVMEEILSDYGINWLFCKSNIQGVQSVAYTAEIVNFFVKHKEVFGRILREGLFSDQEDKTFVFRIVCEFDILESIASAVLDETKYALMLTEESLFCQSWLNAVSVKELVVAKKIWDFFERKMSDRKCLRNYLTWKSSCINALVHAAYHEEPEMIEFIWGLGGTLMDAEERKAWLFDSFSSAGLTSEHFFFDWGFHKFLFKLLSTGYLSGEDILTLLMSRDSCGDPYVLKYYHFGLFNSVLPLDQHVPLDRLVTLLGKINGFNYGQIWLGTSAVRHLNEDLRSTVEAIFKTIVTADGYKLADPLEGDRMGFLIGFFDKFGRRIRVDRFQYFVADFYKQVELDRDRLGRKAMLGRMILSVPMTGGIKCNILHCFLDKPLPLGYICSVLLQLLSKRDVLELLFQPNDWGNSIFHLCLREKLVESWGKVYDVARTLLGEDSLYRVHSLTNGEGNCVQDMFRLGQS